jgi:hypothetical protein
VGPNTIWKDRFENELERAESARLAGNEGMARVCARRAAGIAAGEYLSRNRLPGSGSSAYDRLRYLSAEDSISPQVRDVIDHFLIRITAEHELPIQADLIAEARWLAKTLLE